MARKRPVELATRCFETQKEAIAFFSAILKRYKPGDRVCEEDSFDLSALLELHSEYGAKVGCGVSYFEVFLTEHGTQCFRLVRTDGTGTDFSYLHCMSQQAPSRKLEVSQAFRQIVKLDIYNARDQFFVEHADALGLVICASTGEPIGRDQGHMDHRPPMTFEVIVTTFLAANGLSLDNVPLTAGQDDQVSPEVTNDELRSAFRLYHNKVARLDFVKNTVNLAQSSRNRLKRTRIALSDG